MAGLRSATSGSVVRETGALGVMMAGSWNYIEHLSRD